MPPRIRQEGRLKSARIFLVMVLAGCVSLPWQEKLPKTPKDRQLPGTARSQPAGEVSTPAVTQRTVAAKDEPATLVATDRSKCTVSADKFRETVVGEKVWCLWQ